MMHRDSAGLFADVIKYGFACGAIIASNLHFDKLMRVQVELDLFNDIFCESVIAYHDNRVQAVSQAAQVGDLFGA